MNDEEIENKAVRIYKFNKKAWVQKYSQIEHLTPPFPHISIYEAIALENPRIMPQQAVTTATNIVDIETHLLDFSQKDGVEYISAIDIRASERDLAMADLRFMGITAASMFPGIDGICEELKEIFF
jgi:hypothetical protein